MRSFIQFLCEQASRALIPGKGLNDRFTKGLGSYSKTKVKSGRYVFRKLIATPTEVKVEFTFTYAPGDEKGLYSDNAFATVRRILDGELQDNGFPFNKRQDTPESLAFHGKSNVEYHGKTELTQKTLQLDIDLKHIGVLSDQPGMGYLQDLDRGKLAVWVATLHKQLH